MEIRQQKLPIEVVLVKPSSIDTPYYRSHARNYLSHAPKNPPPVYDPQLVARAILHCAEHPRRDIYVGAAARLLAICGAVLPRVTDVVMERFLFSEQMTDQAPGPRDRHNLFEPTGDGEERGGHPDHVFKTSVYTQLALHPAAMSALALAGAATAIALIGRSRKLCSAYRSQFWAGSTRGCHRLPNQSRITSRAASRFFIDKLAPDRTCSLRLR